MCISFGYSFGSFSFSADIIPGNLSWFVLGSDSQRLTHSQSVTGRVLVLCVLFISQRSPSIFVSHGFLFDSLFPPFQVYGQRQRQSSTNYQSRRNRITCKEPWRVVGIVRYKRDPGVERVAAFVVRA